MNLAQKYKIYYKKSQEKFGGLKKVRIFAIPFNRRDIFLIKSSLKLLKDKQSTSKQVPKSTIIEKR